ncbi:MAG: Nif3-like dinuclear metal center hexameric protein [Gemmatimonadota bacterium]
MPTSLEVAAFLDGLLDTNAFEDYDRALNGLQLDHHGPVTGVATAVDFSRATIDATIAAGANFLVLHHGIFWGGLQPIVGAAWLRLDTLIRNDIAVYSSHLPLDAHPDVGNCARLARDLGLTVSGQFGHYRGKAIGCSGRAEIPTADLFELVRAYSAARGGVVRASAFASSAVTRRWAIVTGAGAGSAEIASAAREGIDTLIVGEGPHHTTVDAADSALTIIYGGHYATETPGVEALAALIGQHFDLPSRFLLLPTGS